MVPNPGSKEAIEQGCTCPVLDNCHGNGVYYDTATNMPVFWLTEGCPLHDMSGECGCKCGGHNDGSGCCSSNTPREEE